MLLNPVNIKADELAEELRAIVVKHIPITLSNQEFALISAAMIIALQRKAADCAAAYGEALGVDPLQTLDLLHRGIDAQFSRSLKALREPKPVTVQ